MRRRHIGLLVLWLILIILTLSYGSNNMKSDPTGSDGDSHDIKGITFVSIPGGSFQMGSNDGEDDEKPVHEVTVSSFEMSATEITQDQYDAVMGNNPSQFEGDDLPVEMVSWYDAVEFCKRLSQTTGEKFSLPTEAEWEYACRAGTETKYYTGDSESDHESAGWFSGSQTHPVGQKTANAFGLYDMSGNVWEWCNDWYGDYTSVSVTDPTGPNSGTDRVVRGGSWVGYAGDSRSANRTKSGPFFSIYDFGFRVVRRP